MNEWIENIMDKDFLQDNLTFTSLFIAIYEHMVDYVVSSAESTLCNLEIKDGEIVTHKTESYKSEILNRIVDEKGNKDKTKASFLWLVDNGAITTKDYEKFLAIKDIRNKYAHELTKVVFEGVLEGEITSLFDMCSLYANISRWFFVEIDAPVMGYEIPDGTNVDEIQNAASCIFNLILNVLYK